MSITEDRHISRATALAPRPSLTPYGAAQDGRVVVFDGKRIRVAIEEAYRAELVLLLTDARPSPVAARTADAIRRTVAVHAAHRRYRPAYSETASVLRWE